MKGRVYMFKVGDKVVYPMYGAGIIKEIEIKELNGINEKYYVIDIPTSKMIVRLSCQKADKAGLRYVMDKETITKIINEVKKKESKVSENWNQRYKDNMDKIKTGEFDNVAEVYKILTLRERQKGLSGAEKKMLSNIKQIASSEISFSSNIEKPEAEEWLVEMLFS